MQPVAGFAVGALIEEAIINFRTSKIKLHASDKIYTIPFTFSWNERDVAVKSADVTDSDFDNSDDETDSDSDSDGGSGSDDEEEDDA
jgi:hypothetical protein